MRYHLSADINCGIEIEVDADNREDAHLIAREALIDHIWEGCDGITTNLARERSDGSTGARWKDKMAGTIEWFDPDAPVLCSECDLPITDDDTRNITGTHPACDGTAGV